MGSMGCSVESAIQSFSSSGPAGLLTADTYCGAASSFAAGAGAAAAGSGVASVVVTVVVAPDADALVMVVVVVGIVVRLEEMEGGFGEEYETS